MRYENLVNRWYSHDLRDTLEGSLRPQNAEIQVRVSRDRANATRVRITLISRRDNG